MQFLLRAFEPNQKGAEKVECETQLLLPLNRPSSLSSSFSSPLHNLMKWEKRAGNRLTTGFWKCNRFSLILIGRLLMGVMWPIWEDFILQDEIRCCWCGMFSKWFLIILLTIFKRNCRKHLANIVWVYLMNGVSHLDIIFCSRFSVFNFTTTCHLQCQKSHLFARLPVRFFRQPQLPND